jgi:hypothetical protein
MKNVTKQLNLFLALGCALVTSISAQVQEIDYARPLGLKGVNVYETKKTDPMAFESLRLNIGAAFTQQFQMLEHSTEAVEVKPAAVNLNQFATIGNNFNNATANLNIDVQLEKGVKVSLVTYLSSRHHQEAWVKGGYIQFDQFPFLPWTSLEKFMKMATIKIGHMEINYGDQHFRRTDNGNASYNAFVGNTLLDAFTTEIGAEIYIQSNDFLGMVSVTNGEIKGDVTAPEKKTGSLILKGGFDSQINDDLRVRLTASYYSNEFAQTNTLYAGDRSGSRYYWVLENTLATATGAAFSGTVNPSFRTGVNAFVINPFVKMGGLEFFGIFENAEGKSSTSESEARKINQVSGELIYRFDSYGKENAYVGARYNTVKGKLVQNGALVAGKQAQVSPDDVTITRMQFTAGWYFTSNVLAKIEYVSQEHKDFINTDFRYNAKFNGLMFEAVVGF